MSPLRQLWPFLRPHRRRLLLVLAATMAVTALSLAPPLLMRTLYDRVVRGKEWELLVWVAAAIAFVPATAAVIHFVSEQMLVALGRLTIARVRIGMYRNLMSLDMGYHSKVSAGAMAGRVMDDVNRLQRLITSHMVRTLTDVLVFVFCLGVTVWLSWRLSIVMFGMLVLYLVVYRVFSRRIWRATWRYRALYDEIGGRLQETVAGVRQVRIYNRESWETEAFVERTATSLDREFATGLSAVSLSTACQAIAGLGSTVVVFLAARHIVSGEMSYGDLFAFNSYLWFAIHPTINLTNMGGMLSEVMVSAGRVAEVLAEEPKVRSRPGASLVPRGEGRVELRDVTFSYVKGEPVIRGVSLMAEPGTAVALVGPTGCGKTTLTSLVMRHWDADSGAVLVDGRDVRDVDLGSLRRLIGVVPQSPVLFEGTLAENIAYGRPYAARAEVEEAARTAEILDLARSLPDGLDTVLGTKGVKLSVGEKQRVAIARAVLTDPEILVMDEATSALDSESEALIQKSLTAVLKGRTSFIVAHRLSTVTRCDLIVVIEAGRIVETGRHGDLLAREGGLYRELYMRLLAQESPDAAGAAGVEA